MKKQILSPVGKIGAWLMTIAFTITAALPALAFFDEDIEDMVSDSESESVEGVIGQPGIGSAMLFWNIKTDGNEQEAVKYRVEYGTDSVNEGAATEFALHVETPDEIPSIKIEDLTNDTAYYFTVIAVFADDSETPPSEEITVTPSGNLEQNMTETPVVVSAEGVSKHEIVIYFSKIIELPEEDAELAFIVTDEIDEEVILEVVSAQYYVDEEGEEMKTEVLVETREIQNSDNSYRITASAQITDVDGQPIESGSTDSAVFEGYAGELDYIPEYESAADEEETETPTENEPAEEEPEASENTEENGDLAEIVQEEDTNGEDETSDLDYILSSLINESGFDAPLDAETGDDSTPPEDVTNLVATFKARLTDFLVTLSWNASVDSAGDLDDQTLYRSTDHGDNWGGGVSLGKETTRTHIPEKPETEITYKITTKDIAGNESVGVIRSVSLPALPQTGPGLLIPFGIALTAAGLRRLKKIEK